MSSTSWYYHDGLSAAITDSSLDDLRVTFIANQTDLVDHTIVNQKIAHLCYSTTSLKWQLSGRLAMFSNYSSVYYSSLYSLKRVYRIVYRQRLVDANRQTRQLSVPVTCFHLLAALFPHLGDLKSSILEAFGKLPNFCDVLKCFQVALIASISSALPASLSFNRLIQSDRLLH